MAKHEMKIGVLALQGAFIEHQKMLESLGAETVQVRLPKHLEGLDGLIIPGGESTTIGKLATQYQLMEPLREFASTRPTWGTCAGMIFLAKDIGIDRQPILGLMDITVNRNAFGRQIDSFEANLNISVLGDVPFHAVFIRAPIATAAKDNVQILSRLDDSHPDTETSGAKDARIVAAKQGHLLATAFHPELTNDTRLHGYFMKMCEESTI